MRTFVLFVSMAALVALAAVAPASAHRDGSTTVAGSWAITSANIVDQKQVGSLVYLRQRGTAAFNGALAGTTNFDLRAFLRPDFSSFGLATEVFTGTIGGRSGTLLLLERVTGGADGSARIDAVALAGTGGLRGLHGQITFVSALCVPETCAGTYSGSLSG